MFDLNREVAAWSAAVYAERCKPDASIEELRDHLYCEIDRARETGLSDEEAFRAAVARLGSAQELTAEHAKNRSVLGTVCQIVAKSDRGLGPEQRRHALIWAALILATSLMLARTAVPDVVSLLLIVAYVPLWWSSDQRLRRALRHQEKAR